MNAIEHHVALVSVHGVWNSALISQLAERGEVQVQRRRLPISGGERASLLLEEIVIDHRGRTTRVSSYGAFHLDRLVEESLRDPFDVVVFMLLPSEAARLDWASWAAGWTRINWRGNAQLLILSRVELFSDAVAGLQAAGLSISTRCCGLREHELAWHSIETLLRAPDLPEPSAAPRVAGAELDHGEPVVEATSTDDCSGSQASDADANGHRLVPAGLIGQTWLAPAPEQGASNVVRSWSNSPVQGYLDPLLLVMSVVAPNDRVEELIITSTTRTEVILRVGTDPAAAYVAAEFDRAEVSPALARMLAHDLARVREYLNRSIDRAT